MYHKVQEIKMKLNEQYFLVFCFQVRESPAPLKIQTPTPAPDRGAPVACLSGPVTSPRPPKPQIQIFPRLSQIFYKRFNPFFSLCQRPFTIQLINCGTHCHAAHAAHTVRARKGVP